MRFFLRAMGEQQISKLLDEQAISGVSMRYAGATDRMDAAMLRSVFHSDSQHANGFVGPLAAPVVTITTGSAAGCCRLCL